jgi:hypothetical protein
MQARRRHLVEPAKPGNLDRRKAFMDILERLAMGVSAVTLTVPRGRHHFDTSTARHTLTPHHAVKPRTPRH